MLAAISNMALLMTLPSRALCMLARTIPSRASLPQPLRASPLKNILLLASKPTPRCLVAASAHQRRLFHASGWATQAQSPNEQHLIGGGTAASPEFNRVPKPLGYSPSKLTIPLEPIEAPAVCAEFAARHDALLASAATGGLSVVHKLLDAEDGLELFRATNKQKHNVLHVASANGQTEIVEYLLKLKGAKQLPLAKGWEGNTALMMASRHGHLDVVKAIVEKAPQALSLFDTVDLEFSSEWGATALHLAAMNGHLDVVTFLSNAGGSKLLLIKNKVGRSTALHLAAVKGRIGVTKYLATHGGQPLICARDIHGFTALHVAAKYGHLAIVKVLSELKGDEPTVMHSQDGHDELHDESQFDEHQVGNHLSVWSTKDLLLAKDTEGQTAAALAKCSNNMDCFSYLQKQELIFANQ